MQQAIQTIHQDNANSDRLTLIRATVASNKAARQRKQSRIAFAGLRTALASNAKANGQTLTTAI